MADFFITFLTAASPLELLLIFSAKIVEVSLGTLRVIIMSKGYRREATVLSFIGVLLWTFIASQVIIGIAAAPIKGIVYSFAFACGVYLGSRIESHLAMGRVLIQAIASKENSETMINTLREKGYVVTTLNASGRDSEKTVLMIFANRKGKEEIIADINRLDKTAMIVTNDVSTLYGGTLASARREQK
jgi:uncharacterized protein YebE (UPF0316 family)